MESVRIAGNAAIGAVACLDFSIRDPDVATETEAFTYEILNPTTRST